MKEKINIVWLKKDLRTQDHAPLNACSNSKLPTLVIFIFEPIVENNYDFSYRHWEYIFQSLKVIQNKIPINIFYDDATKVFNRLNESFDIQNVYSHQETGNKTTYLRDLQIKDFFKSIKIKWVEFPTNAVIRGKKNRNGWDQNWHKVMNANILQTDLNRINFLKISSVIPPYLEEQFSLAKDWKAGEDIAHEQINLFINEKVEHYFHSLSFPEKAQYHCSRLSAHITYGNVSVRQIYQAVKNARSKVRNKTSLDQFLSRLKWHCHFVQKLESEPEIEFKNLNSAFDNIRNKKNKVYIKAWKNGMTGLPLVDAAMRCVENTGYLNFRLRAMVVSFLTHHLWQPWQKGASILARYFIDYEPGIHFSQFQMQAGTTGINTLRIYNPIKQSLEKDADAKFIKTWVPELKDLPTEFIHRPWLMSSMDELLYDFKLGRNYPKPIIDVEQAAKIARDKLWGTKKSDKSKNDAKKILNKHVRRPRKSYAKNLTSK